jgi:hypothetical protein
MTLSLLVMLSPFQPFSGFPDYRFFGGFAKEKYKMPLFHFMLGKLSGKRPGDGLAPYPGF